MCIRDRCPGAGHVQGGIPIANLEKGHPVVYVVSDSIGETAELVARAATSQFNGGQVEIRRFPHIDSEDAIYEVIQAASVRKSMIAYTIIVPELRNLLKHHADLAGVLSVDIMGPMMEALGTLTGIEPKLQPGLVHKLDEEYFRRVEAVEFAVKYDDGRDPRGVFRADAVLIGVSRTSKTPVTMYLAHRRLKVANIPLVPEIPPPKELFEIPASKVVGLTVSPQELHDIREERLKTIGLRGDANYANLERILQELEYADVIFKRVGCPVVDATHKAVEETAVRVLEIINRGSRNGQ